MKRSFHSAFQPVMCLSDGCDSFIMSHPTVYFNHHSTTAPSTTMSTTQNNHHHHFNNQQSSFDQHQMVEDNENVPPPHPLYKRTKLSSKPSHVMTNNGYCIRNFHVDLNKNNNNNNNNNNSNETTRVDSWDYSNTSHVQHLNFLKTFASSSTTASSSSSCGNASQSRQNMNNNYNNNNNNNNNMIADQILMYLTVCTMNGKKMIVALNRQEATVYDLKQSILRKMNIAPDKQILLYEGRPLTDLSLNLYHQCHLRTGHAIQVISPMTWQP